MESLIDQLRIIVGAGWIGPVLLLTSAVALVYAIVRLLSRRSARTLNIKHPDGANITIKPPPPPASRPKRSIFGWPKRLRTGKPQVSVQSPPPDIPEDADLTITENEQAESADPEKPFATDFSDPFIPPPPGSVTTAGPGTLAVPPVAPMPGDNPDYAVRRVYFGTDRRPATMSRNVMNFGPERAGELTIGLAHITVPRKRPWGTIPRPRRIPLLGITIEREKAARHFTISDCRPVDEAEFLARHRRRHQRRDQLCHRHRKTPPRWFGAALDPDAWVRPFSRASRESATEHPIRTGLRGPLRLRVRRAWPRPSPCSRNAPA